MAFLQDCTEVLRTLQSRCTVTVDQRHNQHLTTGEVMITHKERMYVIYSYFDQSFNDVSQIEVPCPIYAPAQCTAVSVEFLVALWTRFKNLHRCDFIFREPQGSKKIFSQKFFDRL